MMSYPFVSNLSLSHHLAITDYIMNPADTQPCGDAAQQTAGDRIDLFVKGMKNPCSHPTNLLYTVTLTWEPPGNNAQIFSYSDCTLIHMGNVCLSHVRVRDCVLRLVHEIITDLCGEIRQSTSIFHSIYFF